MNNKDENRLDEFQLMVGLYDIELITAYILSSAANLNLPMDLKRIQQILYYAQSKYLYKNEQPLFTENIIAKKDGPFVVEANNWLQKEVFKHYNKVPNYTFIGYLDDFIRKEDKKFIDEVLKTFQDLSTLTLQEKVKEEDPWKLTYEENSDNVISRSLIYEFYNSNQENAARLYGVYDDLNETDVINQLSMDPKTYHFSGKYPIKEFQTYIHYSLSKSGLISKKFHSINDVLGYVCDFLIYKERIVTLKELQVILFFIQKMFLKQLDKICFNEFIYKEKDSISIGELPNLYEIDKKELDKELMQEREYDYTNQERKHIAEVVRIKLLEKKANKYAKEQFDIKELEIMDIVLNELIKYPGFHMLNLIQNEKSWINTKLYNVITVNNIKNN